MFSFCLLVDLTFVFIFSSVPGRRIGEVVSAVVSRGELRLFVSGRRRPGHPDVELGSCSRSRKGKAARCDADQVVPERHNFPKELQSLSKTQLS